MLEKGICIKCLYCRSIDAYGNVDCDKGLSGKYKIYCKHFKEVKAE